MPRHRQQTIEEQGGLLVYLDRLQQENNDFPGSLVIKMLDSKATNTSIGHIVGRLPSTIKNWRRVRKEGLKRAKKPLPNM